MNNSCSHFFTIDEREAGLRLDRILVSRFSDHSRSYFHYLFENECISLNGIKAKKRLKPKYGDDVRVSFLRLPEIDLEPQNIPLQILYEDESIIVVNKPSGMVVHPAPGHPKETFANALVYHCKELKEWDGTVRPGIVHRLDKETSGVLLAAKTINAHQKLIEMFSNRQVEKGYLAITIGNPGNQMIHNSIGRHPLKRKEMAVLVDGGKEAISTCSLIATWEDLSYVKIKIATGKTHQIRVHLKHIGTPILGDPVYGNEKINRKWKVKRQLLHASELSLKHPITEKMLSFSAPIPQDMASWIKKFPLQFVDFQTRLIRKDRV